MGAANREQSNARAGDYPSGFRQKFKIEIALQEAGLRNPIILL
jgi:hypothetical protein